MKKYLFVIIILLGNSCKWSNQAEVLNINTDSLISLTFDEFDQTMDGGWRTFAETGDYETATNLIKIYLEAHDDLEPYQTQVLSFHCGQMLALMNENEAAIPYMEASLKTGEDVMNWNVYVEGTIAFLRKDRKAFELRKQELKEKSMFPEGDKNLKVLEMLDKSFDATYKEAMNPE